MSIPFSSRSLAVVCLGVGVGMGSISIWLMRKVQKNITNGVPYQLALKELYACQPVCDLMGRPIKAKYISLSDRRNRIGAKSAEIKIPLKGTKRSGTLHASAENGANGWDLNRLSVELAAPVSKEGWSEVVILAKFKLD